MHCVVTAGPTYEELDRVRRLTNFSTGRLGSELVNYLVDAGHKVTLLIGQQATFRGERHPTFIQTFTTTADLLGKLVALSKGPACGAVLHAAAVSDFTFGRVWKTQGGEHEELRSGKITTREGTILAELVPTPKILPQLRTLFPTASIVGWKYEVDGARADVLALANRQLAECNTNACVANGPAYGEGFGLVTPPGTCVHLPTARHLYAALTNLLT